MTVRFSTKIPYYGRYMGKTTPLRCRDYTLGEVDEIVCQLI